MFRKTSLSFILAILLFLNTIEPVFARAGGRYSSGSGRSFSSSYSNQGSRGSRTYEGGSSNTRSYSPIEKSTTPTKQATRSNQQNTNSQNNSQPNQNSSFFQRNPILSTFGAAMAGSWLGHMMFGGGGYGGSVGGSMGGGGGGFLINLIIMAVGAFFVVMMVKFLTRQSNTQSNTQANTQANFTNSNYEANDFGGQNNNAGNNFSEQNHRGFNIDLDNSAKQTFADLFMQTQRSWSEQDTSLLKHLVTAEMFKYFSDALNQNASQGIENKIENITVLELDISESWREEDMEYATAVIKWSCFDYAVNTSKKPTEEGYIADGSNDNLMIISEAWTFARYVSMNNDSGKWLLSAIQQVL